MGGEPAAAAYTASDMSPISPFNPISRISPSAVPPPVSARGCRPCKPREWEDCVICFEPLASDALILRCKHIFHQFCILRWSEEVEGNANKKPHCPICRAEFEI
eukprot:Tamp_26815.p1 GENE.Tamp_26815~~Tamp_26815.p1  ORF type:complete len:116 (+),score=7.26 Tamp_26815:39-350(+)